MAAPFSFDRTFAFALSSAELWSALERTDDYPRWWGWLREFSVVGLEEGAVARCVVKAPMPYSLRFDVAITRIEPERRIDTIVRGDLDGPATLSIEPLDDGCRARLSWEVHLRPRLLGAAARLARPVMEWGHEWVVATGVSQFRRRAVEPSSG